MYQLLLHLDQILLYHKSRDFDSQILYSWKSDNFILAN